MSTFSELPALKESSAASRITTLRIFQTLRGRKYVILAVTILITLISAFISLQIKPEYTASTQVMIETRQNKVTDIESVVSGLSGDMSAVLSEVEIIKSSALIERLIDKMGLDGDPEFNADLRTENSEWHEYINPINYVPKKWLTIIGLAKESGPMTEDALKANTRAKVTREIKKNLSVSPVRRSMVINIAFISESRSKAAKIANALAELYILDQLEAKFDATKRATRWLSDRLGALKANVENAEKAVENFRTRVASQIGQRSKITIQQISGLNTQLVLAQTKGAEAKARLEQINNMLNAGEEGIASSSDVLNSVVIQSLKSQEAEVVRKVSELDSRYGARHPNMIKAKSELRDLRSAIEKEVKKIAQSLRNEVSIAKAREATLQKNLDRLEKRNSRQSRAAIRLRELEREAKANQILYSNFLNRFKETSSQENLEQADARVISKASIPAFPSYPRKTQIVFTASFFGLILGIALAILLEILQNCYRASSELEEDLGFPILGVTPKVKDAFNRIGVARVPVEKPTSAAAEATRNLLTGVKLSDVDSPPKIISVASTTPSEGKSTIAIWIGQQEAASGKKVILIDCDLRRPSIHTSLQLDNTRSLVSVLAGKTSVEEAKQVLDDTGLTVVPGSDAGGNAMDLISSNKMERLLLQLQQDYDLVVLDSPPILAVAESRIISRLADKVIYIVKWSKTPKDLVRNGISVLRQSGASIAGIVLAQVDTKKQALYGNYDYGYYYGKYRGYYSS